MSIPRPVPQYFLIRIKRQEGSQKKQSIGSIIIPQTHTFMMYNMQAGEVVGIGRKAHEYFPEVQEGHTLLVHHFVEGASESEAREDHLVHQDEDYNYYVVSCFEVIGKSISKRNETYGVWDGEKIIPNKDYIFLEVPPINAPVTADEYINSAINKTASGIFTFKKWEQSRESKAEKMQRLKSEIESLSKSGISKPHITQGIQEREAELEALSLDINARKYECHTIAAFNPILKEGLSQYADLRIGGKIYILNIAAQTQIEFNDKKYIVAQTEYIGGINTISE